MIEIDTSTVIAILQQEGDSDHLDSSMEGDDLPLMPAGTFVEFYAVMKHKGGKVAQDMVDRFIKLADIRIESLIPTQALFGRNAHST